MKLSILAGIVLLASGSAATSQVSPLPASSPWSVRTSLGFDALCALNILSGDPFYTSRYPAETQMFQDARYSAARKAAVEVKFHIKDRHKAIVSALLVLIFSGGPDQSIDDLLRSARDPATLERAFRASAQWDSDEWSNFAEALPSVISALEALQRADFPSWWRENVLLETDTRAIDLRRQLADYDIPAEQGRLMGPTFKGRRLEVILLHFSKPHGISIQGNRYLLNAGYPLDIVLRAGAHEPFHPPFNMADPGAKAAVERIMSGGIVSNIARNHNPDFGYNSTKGLVDEDATEALEQVVSDRLGFSDVPQNRWKADDGMHLLAAAMYEAMRETGFVATGGVFRDWLIAMTARGEFDDAAIEARATKVLGRQAVAKWLPKTGHAS